MDEQRRRDDVIEGELSRAFRAQAGTTAGGLHFDAEAAAAWMERRLDPAASQSMEAHLATCADCQALVATLARTTPEPEPSAGWWSALRRPWLVPAAAAVTAALVIWAVLPQRPSSPQLESTQTRADAVVEPAVPATPEAREFAAEPQTSALSARQGKQVAGARSQDQRGDTDLERARLARQVRDTANAAPQRAAASPPATGTPTLGGAESAAADAGVVAGLPGVEAARKTAREEEAAAAGAVAALKESVTLAARARALYVVAADGQARWRRSGTIIEFAPAANSPFTAAALPLDAGSLVAGSSPAGTVCWLVGASGATLVTTDGVRFARVPGPAATDLVSVTATNARSAVVTAADGRRFRTTDQGATWSPQ